MDRLLWVVVRIKGGSRSRERTEERIEPVVSIPADYKHDGFLDRLLLFAAETTGALVVPTPTRAFFLLPLIASSGISVPLS